MKRKIEHPAPSERELQGPRYWRSLGELAQSPGFQEQLAREFPEGASNLDGVDRRHFFKIMAASFALGGLGLAGCRRPEAHILPYGKSVEGVVQGLPLYFATAMPLRKTAIPLLAETHQGRPTKLEGNPTYTPHGGGTSLIAQASVLDLYDPDRATKHTQGGKPLDPAAVNDVLASLGAKFAGNRGAGLAFLAEESSSPTRARVVAALRQRFPEAIWAEYEPVQDEPPAEAAQQVFGRAVKPVYRFAKAERILSLDCDFLSSEAGSLYFARDFAKGRRVTAPTDKMNRLYLVESGFSLTGGMADHRLRLASSHVLAFAAAIAGKITGDASLAPLASGLQGNKVEAWLTACAADLAEHRGRSLVVAGAHQPAAVHAIAYALNAALGNIGQTIDFVETPASPGAATLADLATAIRGGRVQSLVILGGNPAYNAPADLGFADLLKGTAGLEVIRYGYYVDETSRLAGTQITAAHYLESWGDARTVDGTVVPVQPMILPLFGGLTEIEVLARLAGLPSADPYTLVYETVTGLAGGQNAEDTFKKFLHDGLLAGSAYPVANVSLANVGPAIRRLANGAAAPVALSLENLEVRFVADAKVDDGRFSNNGWLQECPDPMTKIAWDNAILVSPHLGRELGIEPDGSAIQVARKETADFVRGRQMAPMATIEIGGRKVTGPISIQPGLSNFTIVVALGYGRTVSGRCGQGIGFDAYPIRTVEHGLAFATGAKLTLTGETLQMGNTQEHWSMEGRDLVREANYDAFTKDPAFVTAIGMESHTPPIYGDMTPTEFAQLTPEKRAEITAARSRETPRGQSLYEHMDLTGTHQWGMSIDLNTCYGCNACVVACQSENNIPIVGRDQVMRGREMHWIRLDRYYSDGKADAAAFGGEGNRELPEDPQVSMQPMACVHCETAPCETVCPVNATVHDTEGLNVMAYNRCIGTRYCANNCPYKVRRFNFFDWNKRQLDSLYLGPLGPSGMPELVKMVKNPEVTVRMRGVMEKCTYCVQRIQAAKIQQKVKARDSGDVKIPDGTVKVACQQACPVEAIVFGDISDPESAVSKAKARMQDYSLLGYLNVRPRTTYLGKLRNPNEHMPDYVALPYSRQEYDAKNHPAHHGEGEHHDESHDHATH